MIAPVALRPRAGTPRAPGFARAYGRVTVSGYEYGRVIPLAGAAVWAYQPGTVTPWPAALYLDEAGTTPATFPVHTDDSGALELWGEEPGRVELRCQASGYLVQTVVLDLEPVPVEAAGAGEAYTKTESDARYLQAPLTAGQIPAEFLTQTEGDARYALVGSGVDAYTKGESDARYPQQTDPDPYPQYVTLAELPPVTPTDVTVTTDASLTAAESPANTFALGVRLSADAGNALTLRADGLYGTDTTGAGGAYVDEAGDTMTGLLQLQGASGAANVLQAKLAADAQPRFRFDASGKLDWGTGAAAPGITLARTLSGGLSLTGNFYPATTNAHDLGGASLVWQSFYARDVYARSDTGFVQVGVTQPAVGGAVRLRNAASLNWRNAANGADLSLTMNASDQLALAVGASSLTTTAPTAGGAGALPATPTGYLTVVLNGTARRLPYYT